MTDISKNAELQQSCITAVSDRVCYVVECSAGCYDDYHTWIAGVFPDAIDAEKLNGWTDQVKGLKIDYTAHYGNY